MTKETIDTQHVQDMYQKAEDAASKVVEAMARKILRQHPDKYHEFYMAMGTYFFTTKDGENVSTTQTRMNASYEHVVEDSEPEFEELNNFICKWDRRLKITGEPTRFTAYGPRND